MCQECVGDGETCSTTEPCCTGLICNSTTNTCKECAGSGETCNTTEPCCTGFVCYDNACKSTADCLAENEKCGGDDNLSCCTNLTYTVNSTGQFCVKTNGALSLFNMNFSLKQLVGFAVVMVATGLL